MVTPSFLELKMDISFLLHENPIYIIYRTKQFFVSPEHFTFVKSVSFWAFLTKTGRYAGSDALDDIRYHLASSKIKHRVNKVIFINVKNTRYKQEAAQSWEHFQTNAGSSVIVKL